jgi:hypothetical protein
MCFFPLKHRKSGVSSVVGDATNRRGFHSARSGGAVIRAEKPNDFRFLANLAENPQGVKAGR